MRSLLLVCGLLASGCGGITGRPAHRRDLTGLEWPPGDPRVRLERVIGRGSDLRRLSLVRRLAGQPDRQLFERPFGVAWDGEDLLVTDPGAARVVRIDLHGRVTTSSAGALEGPIGVASCPAGIVVSDSRSGRVELLDPSLAPRRTLATGLLRPTGVACLRERLFVAETGRHRLLVLSVVAGAEVAPALRAFGRRGDARGEFNFPTALAADGSALWVGDTLNFRVQRLDGESGAVSTAFGHLGDAAGEMPRLKGLAVDPAGHLWVSDAHLDRVSLYDREGTLLLSLGGSGGEPGRFSFPAGIAASADGRVAVVDSLNRRVQVFRLVGPRPEALP